MSFEIDGQFTFLWKVGTVKYISRTEQEKAIRSPIVEAATLNGSRWYLKLFSPKSFLSGCFLCFLYRDDSDMSAHTFVSITYKLELIDTGGKILKSVVKKNCTFSKGSSNVVEDFLDDCSLALYKNKDDDWRDTQIATLRCHIIDEDYQRQAKIREVPTVNRTQWKIKTPELPNWSKKLKVPFHECTHIDIIMSASDERIYIKVDEVHLLLPYKLRIAVLNDKGREIDFKGSKNLIQSTDGKKHFETWIEKDQLVEQSCLTYSFTVICIVSIFSTNSATGFGSYSFGNIIDESLQSKMASRLPLQEDLKEMLLKEKHNDVKLRVGDKVIPAHKCLLSARSPVFSTMFDQDMLETQTGIVDIPDVESDTVRAFLEFLYTDTITITDCVEVLELMLVADKYQVNILKDRCSVILMPKLSIENICEVVSVAEMVNQSNLKQSAINFIKANKKKILSTPVWSEWMKKNMALANEILLKLIID